MIDQAVGTVVRDVRLVEGPRLESESGEAGLAVGYSSSNGGSARASAPKAEQADNPVLTGGTGKTPLATAFGIEAMTRHSLKPQEVPADTH